MTYDYTKGAYVSVNGYKVAGVDRVKIFLLREATVTADAITVPSSANIVIEITRTRHLNDKYSDKIRFQTLSNFNLVVYADHCTSVFGGCQWTDYSEDMGNDNKIVDTIKITAHTYSVTYPQ